MEKRRGAAVCSWIIVAVGKVGKAASVVQMGGIAVGRNGMTPSTTPPVLVTVLVASESWCV